MNHSKKIRPFLYFIALITIGITACKKDNSLQSGTTDASTTTSSTITVAASNSSGTTDSLYIVQPCPKGSARDSIAASALPASVTSYLNSNYAGYTFGKAYSIKDSSGIVSGYITIIYYNDKPVGLSFDSNGNFVKVLEQREKGDLQGKGWHHGGRFEDRGGIIKDTVALSSLPSGITSYFTSNYPADTLIKP